MQDDSVRYFCNVTGVRLVAPGVSKSVDPEKGVAEWSDSASARSEEKPPAAKPKGKKEESE